MWLNRHYLVQQSLENNVFWRSATMSVEHAAWRSAVRPPQAKNARPST
jgi:hypothetical protein